MPIDILTSVIFDGPESLPAWDYIKTYGPALLTIGCVKYYFRGSSNTWERDMHGKVFIITGGTSGLGAYISYYLASKGAQIVLLAKSTEDSWLVDYVEDLREKTNNFLIYAEECDLNSLYSTRKFATKWLDNQPPRRLDGVICCAAETIPIGKPRQTTVDGVERQIGINYLSHYHLLTLLGPSLRVQPPDRDVRVLIATCASQALGEVDLDDLLWSNKRYPSRQPWKLYGSSKLMLGLFAKEYQKRLNNYERKDKAPCNVRINLVNPGLMRTPSTRRFLSMGKIWGLLVYLILFPIWFIFFKSTSQGAQSFLFALFAPIFRKIDGGNLIQECKILKKTRDEFNDEELQEEVFNKTEDLIKILEKQSAIERKKREKSQESKKPLAEKLRAENDVQGKNNLYTKPEDPEELEAKLNLLRSMVGIDTTPKGNLPLFPDQEITNTKVTRRSSENPKTGKTT